jgi:S-adenosylmethionine:tRNA ribosyltransferase-isomerase
VEQSIKTKDYEYDLPSEQIALYPLAERDQSKLLVYKQGTIGHHQFNQIANFLPKSSTLFFNDTKVIPARLHFQKTTGATIEIFLLNPADSKELVQQAMATTATSRWICTIGNLKRWTDSTILIKEHNEINLTAKIVDRTKSIVEFSWQPQSKSFAEIITIMGLTPLPPYLNRKAEASDRTAYQTVYSHYDGAVAAPTAGLHFTDRILNELTTQGHFTQFLTLHVSAGTFQPIKVENALNHVMHNEQVVVTKKNVAAVLSAKSIVAIGTTSMRTLESLYWYGVKLIDNPAADFKIEQGDPYKLPQHVDLKSAFNKVLDHFNTKGIEVLTGQTSIYMVPGYSFKVVDALITNFHQPGSTLILLIAAFAGPGWKTIYEEALKNKYRFLSYGDSSLLFRKVAT